MSDEDLISTLATESRRFAPDPAFSRAAVAQPNIYDAAAADRLGFWAE
ncbi:MAG: hypothetical protein RL719_896, partial [Actinomycetota bacterium]